MERSGEREGQRKEGGRGRERERDGEKKTNRINTEMLEQERQRTERGGVRWRD